MDFIPKTKLGKWSLSLIIALIVLFLFMSLVLVGLLHQTGGDTLFDNIPLAITAILAGLCGISSFITGIISIFKQKERSLFVYLSTLISFLLIIFLLGELFSPH